MELFAIFIEKGIYLVSKWVKIEYFILVFRKRYPMSFIFLPLIEKSNIGKRVEEFIDILIVFQITIGIDGCLRKVFIDITLSKWSF